MKTCLVLIALIGAVCAGGAIVYLNPSLVPQAEHTAQRGASWVSGELAQSATSTAPSAVPTVASVPRRLS